jgi:hypothetical protein
MSARLPSFVPAAARLALAGVLLAGCEGDCPRLERCDIRSGSCQRHTAKVAACLAGEPGVAVPVSVVDAASFIDDAVGDASETPDERDLRRGLALLGLMPSEQDPAAAERTTWSIVAAFYDPETAAVTVLDRGENEDDSVRILLHEMIHAIQYQRPGLAAQEEAIGGYDAGRAWDALIEGEAVLYQDLATVDAYGFEAEDFDWPAVFGNYEAYGWRRMLEADDAFRISYAAFVYAFGGAYVNQAWHRGGSAAVRALYSDPPGSTRQVAAGYGAQPPFGVESWHEAPLAQGRPLLPPEYEPVRTLDLGAWLLHAVQSRRLGFSGYAGLDYAGLQGDVLNIVREPASGAVSVFWRLRFDSGGHASALVDELEALPSTTGLVHEQRERDVVIAASTLGNLDHAFVRSLSWAPLEALDPDASEAAAARRLCPALPAPLLR